MTVRLKAACGLGSEREAASIRPSATGTRSEKKPSGSSSQRKEEASGRRRSTPSGPGRRAARRSPARRREAVQGYLYISPWFIGFLFLIAGPVFLGVISVEKFPPWIMKSLITR